MKERILFNLMMITLTLMFLLIIMLTLKLNAINDKLYDMEDRNLQIHEYILDRVGA